MCFWRQTGWFVIKLSCATGKQLAEQPSGRRPAMLRTFKRLALPTTNLLP